MQKRLTWKRCPWKVMENGWGFWDCLDHSGKDLGESSESSSSIWRLSTWKELRLDLGGPRDGIWHMAKFTGRQIWVSHNKDLSSNSHSEMEIGCLARWSVSYQKTFKDRPRGPLSELSTGSCFGKVNQVILKVPSYLTRPSMSSVSAYSRFSRNRCQMNET